MMDIQKKRDLLMSLPLMEQEQRWIMERLDTLSVKEQYQLSAAILRTGKPEELAGKSPKEIRAELSKTRSAMSEIGSRVSEEIYRRRADRNKEQER